MLWSLEYVINECKRLSAAKGDVFSIPVEVYGRLRTTLARVMGSKDMRTGKITPLKMEISKKAMELTTEDEILRIIRHEWCHYYLDKTTDKDHGHDATFNRLALEVGGQEGTTIAVSAIKQQTQFKYEIFCSCCGKMVGHRSRVCSLIKQPEGYESGCCGSPLKVKQNW